MSIISRMQMRNWALFAILCCFSGLATANAAEGFPFFHSGDPLAARDSWGKLHQSPALLETDYAPRESWRFFYYSKSRHDLAKDVAYVGAVQTVLQRTGYYCGPIDGVYSPDVTDAIARLQKNHSMRVTGSLTVGVRRVLFLP